MNSSWTGLPACMLMRPGPACTACPLLAGADSRHKSLALWEKLLARQAAAVRAIRHRAAVANTPGASGVLQLASPAGSLSSQPVCLSSNWHAAMSGPTCASRQPTATSCSPEPAAKACCPIPLAGNHNPSTSMRVLSCRWCTPQGPPACLAQPAVSTGRVRRCCCVP